MRKIVLNNGVDMPILGFGHVKIQPFRYEQYRAGIEAQQRVWCGTQATRT